MENVDWVVTYLRVRWLHSESDYPVMFYSELNEERYEVRKVEIFSDGRMNYADKTREMRCMLGDQPVPPLAEIAAQGEFEPEVIRFEEFQAVWTRAAGS